MKRAKRTEHKKRRLQARERERRSAFADLLAGNNQRRRKHHSMVSSAEVN